MGDTPPPTEHVLRPHHVGLLTVFMLALKEFESRTLPPPFMIHIYRVLLNEVSEVCHVLRTISDGILISQKVAQPKTSQELIQTLSVGPGADAEEAQSLISSLKGVVSLLSIDILHGSEYLPSTTI
jgi:anaphase-promoting complex subunit 5